MGFANHSPKSTRINSHTQTLQKFQMVLYIKIYPNTITAPSLAVSSLSFFAISFPAVKSIRQYYWHIIFSCVNNPNSWWTSACDASLLVRLWQWPIVSSTISQWKELYQSCSEMKAAVTMTRGEKPLYCAAVGRSWVLNKPPLLPPLLYHIMPSSVDASCSCGRMTVDWHLTSGK